MKTTATISEPLQKANDAISTVIKKNEAMSNILMGMLEHIAQAKSDLDTLDDSLLVTEDVERTSEQITIYDVINDIDLGLFGVAETIATAIGSIVSEGLVDTLYFKSEK